MYLMLNNDQPNPVSGQDVRKGDLESESSYPASEVEKV